MTIGELNVNREAWKDTIFEVVVLGVLIAIVWVIHSLLSRPRVITPTLFLIGQGTTPR